MMMIDEYIVRPVVLMMSKVCPLLWYSKGDDEYW